MAIAWPIHLTPYDSIALVLLVAALVAAIGFKLRQPLIISFLLAGVLVGPTGLKLVQSQDIKLLAEIGISLLLFVVGLRLDVRMIKTVGPVALATGIGQVLFTSLVGFGLCLMFGLSYVTSAYVAVALTFSSTIIIVKLLSDKKEIDALHGRIAVGFLIVQDIVAVLALIFLTAFGGGLQEDSSLFWETLLISTKGLAMLGAVILLARYALPGLLGYLSRSQELLVVFAITWAVVLGAAAEWLGFTKEVGAFLAGISLASTVQRDAIGARLVVLRDFLLLFFFINLGAQLQLRQLGNELVKASVFSAFVLIGNPLIVMTIMGIMGYRRRTGFMCGLTVAQISEFSLILGALGLALGHIDEAAMSLITLVGLVTICASTYMILFSGPLYDRIGHLLKIFERRRPNREAADIDVPASAAGAMAGMPGDPHQVAVIQFGFGNYGREIAGHLRNRGRRVVVVDFDPHALTMARQQGFEAVYGDVGDPEILAQLPLDAARWVVSAVRDATLSMALLNLLRDVGYKGQVAVSAGSPAEARDLRAAGAAEVLQPFSDAAEQAADLLTGAVHTLPGLAGWPATIREIMLRPGSVFAGKRLRDIPLRHETGASVLAVSRAGYTHFNPGPEFQLFPGDRLALLGDPQSVTRAVEYMDLREIGQTGMSDGVFAIGNIAVSGDSVRLGRTLAELDFRRAYDVTVIGLRRGEKQIVSPSAAEHIEAEDQLIVVGSRQAVNRLQEMGAL